MRDTRQSPLQLMAISHLDTDTGTNGEQILYPDPSAGSVTIAVETAFNASTTAGDSVFLSSARRAKVRKIVCQGFPVGTEEAILETHAGAFICAIVGGGNREDSTIDFGADGFDMDDFRIRIPVAAATTDTTVTVMYEIV